MVAKESAAIRASLKDAESHFSHRNVAKLMYLHMLGYPTHWGQMECVTLIARASFPEKRIGYLGLMVLLDERQEVTMMVTNTIKNDLKHRNHFIAGLALCTLGNICTAEMARDVAPEVASLLHSKNSYVRKKAALCSVRIVKKVPDLADEFVPGTSELLSDRHHGVLLCAVTLALELCVLDQVHVTHFRKHVPVLVKILMSLIRAGYSAEHDVGGHADPFLQVKLLQLLAKLGAGDADASDAMSDVLANVASNTDGSKNAGNAILYEAVNAIIGTESVGGLRVLAVNILGRFLGNKDNNIRYVALNTLAKVVAVDTQAVQRHRHTIVECVKDSDVTIRRSALQLVYALVNDSNIKTLAKELLDYLGVADVEFKSDLTRRIAQLITKYAPDRRWHVDTMVELLSKGGSYVAEEEARDFIVLITNSPELQGYAGRALFRAAFESEQHSNRFQLSAVAAWVLGEYGDAVVAQSTRLQGEVHTVVAEADVVKLLESILGDYHAPTAVKQVAITALAKLGTRLKTQTGAVRGAMGKAGTSANVELQQRASEFCGIFDRGPALAVPLLERLPPFVMKSKEALHGVAGRGKHEGTAVQSAPGGGGGGTAGGVGDLLGDLTGLDDSVPSSSAAAGGSAGGADLLGDLMAGYDATPGYAATPTGASVDPLADLMGGVSMQPTTTATATAADPFAGGAAAADPLGDLMGTGAPSDPFAGGAAAAAADPLGDLMGTGAPSLAPQTRPQPAADPLAGLAGGIAATPAATPPMNAAAFDGAPAAKSFIAFYKDGVEVSFVCAKPDPMDPSKTTVTATTTNRGGVPLLGYALQAAVPKTMSLSMRAASGDSVPANGAGRVTQRLDVTNSQHGTKALAMRLRLAWNAGGAAVVEQATVDFPPGL